MNAMTPDPAAVLAKLHAATVAVRDAADGTAADVLSNRVCGIQDVLFTLPTADPAALRIQSDAIRVLVADFTHESHIAAIMTLAATYADMLADRGPAGAETPTGNALDVDDAVNLLGDAAAAVMVAARGLNDRSERQAFAALTDLLSSRLADLADTINGTNATEAAQ